MLASWRASSDPVLSGRLHQAAELGQIEVLERLIGRGVSVNSKRHRGGRTALMKAASRNHYEVVKLLLRHGASVDPSGGKSLKTALMRAAENNCTQTMALLIAAGADPNKRNNFTGKTSLMIAAENGHLEAVDILLGSGANPNIHDHKGRTALMYAVSRSYRNGPEMIVRLIQAGSNPNEADHQGLRPLDIAYEAGLLQYVELLEAQGASSVRKSRGDEQYFELAALKKAYITLNSSEQDSDDAIRGRYHALVKKWHPDSMTSFDIPEEFVDQAQRKFQEIYEAYRLIMKSRNGLRQSSEEI